MAPTDNALLLTPPGSLPVVYYYSTCEGANPFNTSLAEAYLTTSQLSQGLNLLLSSGDSPPECRNSSYLIKANDTVQCMFSNLSWIESQLSCEPIQSQWVEVMNFAMCEEYYVALFIFFSSVFCMSILFFYYLLAASRVLTSLEVIKHTAWIASINDLSAHDTEYFELIGTCDSVLENGGCGSNDRDDDCSDENYDDNYNDEKTDGEGDVENQVVSRPPRAANISPLLNHSTTVTTDIQTQRNTEAGENTDLHASLPPHSDSDPHPPLPPSLDCNPPNNIDHFHHQRHHHHSRSSSRDRCDREGEPSTEENRVSSRRKHSSSPPGPEHGHSQNIIDPQGQRVERGHGGGRSKSRERGARKTESSRPELPTVTASNSRERERGRDRDRAMSPAVNHNINVDSTNDNITSKESRVDRPLIRRTKSENHHERVKDKVKDRDRDKEKEKNKNQERVRTKERVKDLMTGAGDGAIAGVGAEERPPLVKVSSRSKKISSSSDKRRVDSPSFSNAQDVLVSQLRPVPLVREKSRSKSLGVAYKSTLKRSTERGNENENKGCSSVDVRKDEMKTRKKPYREKSRSESPVEAAKAKRKASPFNEPARKATINEKKDDTIKEQPKNKEKNISSISKPAGKNSVPSPTAEKRRDKHRNKSPFVEESNKTKGSANKSSKGEGEGGEKGGDGGGRNKSRERGARKAESSRPGLPTVTSSNRERGRDRDRERTKSPSADKSHSRSHKTVKNVSKS